MGKPTLGQIVLYRDIYGLKTMQPAIVVATVDSLKERMPTLDNDQHVHLQVFTYGVGGPGRTEYNIGPGNNPGEWRPTENGRANG